jgi:glycosyltransferase involved in cell wall biosynthesis
MTCSVCLCTCNGEAYLSLQINSILAQPSHLLGELIIVDDCSTDSTFQLLTTYADHHSCIRLFANPRRLGVLKNFEKCLSLSTNPIVVLCDQDDVWAPEKLSSITSAGIDRQAGPALFLHNASVVNQEGVIVFTDFQALKGGFHHSLLANFVSNRFLGCCMAVNRELLSYALPIPRFAPQHDIWFGIIASVAGRCIYSDSILTFYRSHLANVSPASSNKSGSIMQIAWRRYTFVLCVLVLLWRMVGRKVYWAEDV